jgi:hypothetical protein
MHISHPYTKFSPLSTALVSGMWVVDVALNKDGGPWISLTLWWRTLCHPIVIDLGLPSFERLHRRIPNGRHDWSLPCGWCFDRVQPCFSDRLVFEGALWSSAICSHHGTWLSSTVKIDAENGMESGNWRLAMEFWESVEILAWWFVTWSRGIGKCERQHMRNLVSKPAG